MNLNVLYLKNHTIPRFGLWRKRRRWYYYPYPSFQLRCIQHELIRSITKIMPTLEIFWIIIDTIPKKKILKSDSTQNRVIYRHHGFNIIKKDIYKRTALRLKTCTSILSLKPWKFSKCFTLLKEGTWHERPYRMNWRQRHQSMNFENNLKPLYEKPQNVPLSSLLKAR